MMAKIYYSPKCFWKWLPAVEKLAKEAKVSKQQALGFLKKQALWHIYWPPPKKIIRPRYDASIPNEIHQAELLLLPHDTVNRKTYKYALTVVDIESRYKDAGPMTSKDSKEGVWEYLQAKVELSEATTGGPLQGIYGLCDTANGKTQRKYQTGQERDPQRPGFG